MGPADRQRHGQDRQNQIEQGVEIARGLSSYSSEDARLIKGHNSGEIEELLGSVGLAGRTDQPAAGLEGQLAAQPVGLLAHDLQVDRAQASPTPVMNDPAFPPPSARSARPLAGAGPDRPPKPVLIVLHQEHSSPGRVGRLLQARGHAVDIRKARFGDALPGTMRDHAGAVIFGGPMGANDPEDFIKAEIDWIGTCLKEDAPFLGICLGAQMLVNHLGGRVEGHGDGLVEIGWYPLTATDAGRRLMHWPDMVYQFHREGFSLPKGATLLATAQAYPNQAFRYGDNAWGIQFHAELTRMMMHRWVVRGAQRFELPGAQPGRDHLGGRLIWDMHLKRWLGEFLATVFGRIGQ